MSVVVTSNGSVRSAQAPVGTNGTVTGTVTNASGGAAVAGGTIRLIQGGVTLTATPNGSGVYTFSNVAPGSYTVDNQPPLPGTNTSFSIADAGSFSISVSAGGTTTQNFSVQASLYDTDYQNFTTAQLVSVNSPLHSGDFFYHNSTLYQTNGLGGAYGGVSYDTTTVPTGLSKACLYTFPPHGNSAQNPASLVSRINPMPSPLSSGYTTIAYRFSDYCSTPFDNGGAGQVSSAREYKYYLFQLGPSTGTGGNGNGQIGLYMEQASNGANRFITMDSTDKKAAGGPNTMNINHAIQVALTPNKWNTWVVSATGLGSSSTTIILYLNGTAVITLNGAFRPDLGSLGTDATDVLYFRHGEQFNNGPDQQQQRWLGEFGLYNTRPNILPLVP